MSVVPAVLDLTENEAHPGAAFCWVEPRPEPADTNPQGPGRLARIASAAGPAAVQAFRWLTSESMGVAVMAAMVMALSYSGLYDFAVHAHLPNPWLFPLAFDLPAVVCARGAWRAHHLGDPGRPARAMAAVLVAASTALQVSPIMAQVHGWSDVWVHWPDLVAHAAPALIGYGLLELYLWLRRLEAPPARKAAARAAARAARRTEKERKAEAKNVQNVQAQTPADTAGHELTPVAAGNAGRKGPEVAMGPPPADLSITAEETVVAEAEGEALDLADAIQPFLVANDIRPTKITVRDAIVSETDRATCSWSLALKVLAIVKRQLAVQG